MSLINIETVKIKDIIHQVLAFEAVGYKLFDTLKKVIESENKPKLLILDFSDLDLLTYGFVEIALKGIVKYTKENNDLIMLYKINKPELQELITGVIEMLELQKNNTKSIDERNLLAMHYPISYFEGENNIEYIGEINNVEKDILKIIESKGKTTHNEIDTQLKSEGKDNYCEDIAKSVSKLYELGFIHHIEKNKDVPSIYFSLKKLQNHEN